MTNFIVIFICLIAGIIANRIRQFPHQTPQVFNAFIIYITLPALVLAQVPAMLVNLDFEGRWWLPISMAWICFILSYIIFSSIGKKIKWSDSKTGALILTAGLGNTSFVGIPILEALIGKETVPIAILVDQPGSFLTLATLGIIVAAFYSGAKITPKFILRRVFTFPPFVVLFLVGIWFVLFGRSHPNSLSAIYPSMEKISATLVPLALFSVGYQLHFDLDILKKRWIPLTLGLSFRLLLFPAFFAFFYMKVLGGSDLTTQVIVLESAMATMITSAVVANEFNLDSEIANLMVGLSIPISLVTVPLWKYFLGF